MEAVRVCHKQKKGAIQTKNTVHFLKAETLAWGRNEREMLEDQLHWHDPAQPNRL